VSKRFVHESLPAGRKRPPARNDRYTFLSNYRLHLLPSSGLVEHDSSNVCCETLQTHKTTVC
jgi:hypothetical protein